MKTSILFALLFAAPWFSHAQTFIFDDAVDANDFTFHRNDSHIVCFYKTYSEDKINSHFRTVVLNAGLELVDTINYMVPGECTTLLSSENDLYGYHIFHSAFPDKRESISFLITDKFGKVVAHYEKSAEDFKALLGKKINLAQLGFNEIATSGSDAGMMLLQPVYFFKSGGVKWSSQFAAFNMLDGSLLSKFVNFVPMQTPIAAKGRLTVLQRDKDGSSRVHCYTIATGEQTAQFLISQPDRNRRLSVFEVKDSVIVVAGVDAKNGDRTNTYSGFFVSRFDFNGRRVFDKMEASERLPDSRMEVLGGLLTTNGDIVIIGESYKNNNAATAAKATGKIALALLGGPIMIGGNESRVVQSVISARVSPDGTVAEFYSFPVDKRNKFSSLIKDDRQVYLRNQQQLLWYDLDHLQTAPRKFTKLTNQEVVITLYGNLIGLRRDTDKKEIIIEVIPGDSAN